MFAEQLRVGRPAPDYGRSSGDHVVAVLPGGPANMAMTKWVLEQENQQGAPLRLQKLQVLAELLRERQMTTVQLAAVVQRTDAETRNLLTRMVERGWVQPRGEGKARNWHLSAAVYRVLDAPSGYVRVHGFEPLQQEQMILQYVQVHAQITRNQAAELCGLSPDQASRLLRRLVSAGKLSRQAQPAGREQRKGLHAPGQTEPLILLASLNSAVSAREVMDLSCETMATPTTASAVDHPMILASTILVPG